MKGGPRYRDSWGSPHYILTDAKGFTTSCWVGRNHDSANLLAEVERANLKFPIEIREWHRVNGHGPFNGWKCLREATWRKGNLQWR